MGQSLVKNYIHIVFSTKHRQELIYPPIEDELYAYLGGICLNLECTPIKIGGYTEHIHILCMLSKKIALMTLVEKLEKYKNQIKSDCSVEDEEAMKIVYETLLYRKLKSSESSDVLKQGTDFGAGFS